MLKFEDIEMLLKEGGYTHCRISDSHNSKLFDLEAPNPEGLFQKLKSKVSTFQSYETVIIKAGNSGDKKNHFANATRWRVNFASVQSNTSVPSEIPASNQMILKIAELQSTIVKLQTESIYEKRLSDLENKYKNDDGFSKYLPMAGLLFDFDDTKLNKMLKLSQISGIMNGTFDLNKLSQQQPALAGLPDNVAPDKIDEALDMIAMKISENKNINKKDLLTVLSEINNRPELLQKAVQFINLKMI